LVRVAKLSAKLKRIIESETSDPDVKVLLFTHYQIVNALKETDGINPETGKMVNKTHISYCQTTEIEI